MGKREVSSTTVRTLFSDIPFSASFLRYVPKGTIHIHSWLVHRCRVPFGHQHVSIKRSHAASGMSISSPSHVGPHANIHTQRSMDDTRLGHAPFWHVKDPSHVVEHSALRGTWSTSLFGELTHQKPLLGIIELILTQYNRDWWIPYAPWPGSNTRAAPCPTPEIPVSGFFLATRLESWLEGHVMALDYRGWPE